MKINKYTHACMALEEQGKRIVIDPGSFSDDFTSYNNIAAVVVTHVHGDHLEPRHLAAIVAANANVQIFTTPEVVAAWGDAHATAVKAGDHITVGPFELTFYGELHAEIHPMAPRNQNIGVLINNFYYPGDSFVAPDKPVALLAVPAAAPWLKTGEAIDFVGVVKPKQFMRAHDAMLNERGLATTDSWFTMASEHLDVPYAPLQPGDALEF